MIFKGIYLIHFLISLLAPLGTLLFCSNRGGFLLPGIWVPYSSTQNQPIRNGFIEYFSIFFDVPRPQQLWHALLQEINKYCINVFQNETIPFLVALIANIRWHLQNPVP